MATIAVLKRALVIICVVIGFFGIVYSVVALPFTSPTFDLIAWSCIGVATLILMYIGRK